MSFGSFAENKQTADSEKNKQIENRDKKNIKKKKSSEKKSLTTLKYIPPFLGAPSTDRLNGMGARNPEKQIDLLFSVLAPADTSLTSLSQPDLYWYTSESIPQSFQFIEFVLNSEKSIAPVFRTRLPLPEKTGTHLLSLKDYKITLKPEVEYSWSISLIKKPESRSMDLVSNGKVKYLKSSEILQQRLKKSAAKQVISIYAQSGYWYDAISMAIQQQKEHPDFLSQLINQIELQAIAENIDRERKNKTDLKSSYSMQLPNMADK